jgi:hypothetical protein
MFEKETVEARSSVDRIEIGKREAVRELQRMGGVQRHGLSNAG